ncbi:UDP-N-acetylmuramoylalanyl-D-glutamate--2,6-diaminopimelate ligase [gamma proteobacterium HdN1]|nr:UDP-N-acetylmuramoylalanyl-D-glutamate--2,6-diaminopimelate ligase [gamma proteobacterium HdN1]
MSARSREKRLGDLLAVEAEFADVMVSGLQQDSRKVQHGDLFVALKGHHVDGRDYIKDALKRGASAVLADRVGVSAEQVVNAHGNVIWRDDLRSELGDIASRFYDEPSKQMRVIAVTGTNGKTTVSHLLVRLLMRLGESAKTIGTLGYGHPDHLIPLANTTPDAIQLHEILAACREDGARFVAMEASSHGLDQGRLGCVEISTAVFTNITRDHLDYHQTMQAYWEAKAKLASWHGLRNLVLNADDAGVAKMAAVAEHGVKIVWFSLRADANVDVALVRCLYHPRGMSLDIRVKDEVYSFDTRLMGEFNVANILAVLAALVSEGFSASLVVDALKEIAPVKGRMDCLPHTSGAQLPAVVIDYAHTPDALQQALNALRHHCTTGKLWCVFGCGGDRDKGKRPLMGKIAASSADRVVVTSDNPRSEVPDVIIAEIRGGMEATDQVRLVTDRGEAIRDAIFLAAPEDVILIAGKGHEDYQEVRGVRSHFSDHEVAAAALLQRAQLSDSLPKGCGSVSERNQQECTLASLAERLGGELRGEDLPFAGVSTDTRALKSMDVFFALVGEKFDAHDFLQQAKVAGACGAVVSRWVDVDLPQIKVEDTRLALGAWAGMFRDRFHPRVVAVTGSSGKTSVKEMLAAIFSEEGRVLATSGNLNNDIGVPLTLLRLDDSYQFAVIELGANHVGEIAYTVGLVRPDAALITNVGEAHLEGFGSRNNIAKAKSEIYTGLVPKGVAVVNLDDDYSQDFLTLNASRNVLTFSIENTRANCFAKSWSLDPVGRPRIEVSINGELIQLSLNLIGKHQIANALAAAAAARAAGASLTSIRDGLNKLQPFKGRMFPKSLGRWHWIDDTYNANPSSMRAAIDALARLDEPKVLILGRMGELGEQSAKLHADIGAYAARAGIRRLFISRDDAGDYARGYRSVTNDGQLFVGDGPEAIAKQLIESMPEGVVLVKGSRSAAMEKVFDEAQKRLLHEENH